MKIAPAPRKTQLRAWQERIEQEIQRKQIKPTLCDPFVKSFPEALRKRFVVVAINQPANDFAFICKKYYISKLISKVGFSSSKSKPYSKITHSIEEIIQANMNYCEKCDANITKFDKTLQSMHWLSKMQKTPIGARLIVVSKNSLIQNPKFLEWLLIL